MKDSVSTITTGRSGGSTLGFPTQSLSAEPNGRPGTNRHMPNRHTRHAKKKIPLYCMSVCVMTKAFYIKIKLMNISLATSDRN